METQSVHPFVLPLPKRGSVDTIWREGHLYCFEWKRSCDVIRFDYQVVTFRWRTTRLKIHFPAEHLKWEIRPIDCQYYFTSRFYPIYATVDLRNYIWAYCRPFFSLYCCNIDENLYTFQVPQISFSLLAFRTSERPLLRKHHTFASALRWTGVRVTSERLLQPPPSTSTSCFL